MAKQQHALGSIEEIAKELKDAAWFIGQRVINREEVIEQAICALLTAEHLLLQSRTGVGKSLLAEQIFNMFEGARLFRVQASKEQQPDTYFGGLDLEQLKTGRIIHNTSGSLVESEFGFIDEIFDANDFTLRALLSLLNERRLMRGVQDVHSPLHTVIAATNYLRVSEVTEALLDRFLFKAVILPDKDPFVQYQISQRYLQHGGKPITPPKKISFERLQHMHRMISGRSEEYSIEISNEVLYFTNIVIRHFEFLRNRQLHEHVKSHDSSDFYISPRTQAKSLDLLRALALLKGRSHVVHDDVSRLYFVFATVGLPEEIVWRQPFPGPGLGIRIIGEVTKERLDLLRHADLIAREELKLAGLDRQIWQCPVVLLADVRSVGVQGDGRTYGHPIVLRPVSSEDAMTADWSRIPYETLEKISTRITNEVREVNRVVLDVTSKPPGTIEWE